MHKSGRRNKYKILVAGGEQGRPGGGGHNSAREIREAIRKATLTAKMNLVEIARGCGSWECRCDRPHSVPVEGRGEVRERGDHPQARPQGLGLVASEIPKTVLELAGVRDAWTFSRGETRTTLNLAMATLEALKNLTRVALVGRKRGHSAGPGGRGVEWLSSLAVVRLRGSIKARKEVVDTLRMMGLTRVNHCVLLSKGASEGGDAEEGQGTW